MRSLEKLHTMSTFTFIEFDDLLMRRGVGRKRGRRSKFQSDSAREDGFVRRSKQSANVVTVRGAWRAGVVYRRHTRSEFRKRGV